MKTEQATLTSMGKPSLMIYKSTLLKINTDCMLHWTPNYLSSMPMHQQLTRYIQLKIGSKGFCKDDYLPPTRAMSSHYKISEDIIKKAYSMLVSTGLIHLQKDKKRYFFNGMKTNSDISVRLDPLYTLSDL